MVANTSFNNKMVALKSNSVPVNNGKALQARQANERRANENHMNITVSSTESERLKRQALASSNFVKEAMSFE